MKLICFLFGAASFVFVFFSSTSPPPPILLLLLFEVKSPIRSPHSVSLLAVFIPAQPLSCKLIVLFLLHFITNVYGKGKFD